MQSESGSRENESALVKHVLTPRGRERMREWARAQAEAQADVWVVWAEVWARAWVKERQDVWTEVWARARARVGAPAKVWTEMWALAQEEAPAMWPRAQVKASAEVWPRKSWWRSAVDEVSKRWWGVGTTPEPELEMAQVVVSAQVEVSARGQADAQAQVRAYALVRALKMAVERRMLPPEVVVSNRAQYAPTYHEVLADSKIKHIIDSIEPKYHHSLARRLWRHSAHRWLIQIIAPVTRLPPELLRSILSIIINDTRNSPLVLMLVCNHWYTIVTSIWASFKLGTSTPRDTTTKKLERNQWFLDIVVDTETDRGDFTHSKGAYESIFATIEATSRWRSLVVETFPGQTDLPGHLVDRGLQRCSDATMSRLRSFKIKCACEMSPLLDRLLRILGTTASAELTTVEINSENVISFLVPVYSAIFRSVKVLFLDISGMHNPVDLLPSLHQLETLTASHLSLPIYAHDIDLPFVNTLRHLTLSAVSIQWMSGRTFAVLERCTISFPLHHHILPVFSTTLPNCEHLTFQGCHIDTLDGVSAHKLIHLSVTSSGSFNRRGARQLVSFSSRVLGESQFALRTLHISIGAISQAWINALTFVPHLEELVIGNARPSSLRAKVLQSLIARPVHTSNLSAIAATGGEWVAPLCPLLRRFGLKYRRWLRTSEHFDMIPDFLSIISSRTHSNCPLQSFRVWTRSGQEDPLELVEESQITPKGFQRLANGSGIEQEDVLDLVFMKLMDSSFPGVHSNADFMDFSLPSDSDYDPFSD